jgi:signal transduction histidine kinase
MGKFPGTEEYDQVHLLDVSGVSRLAIPAGQPSPADAVVQRARAVLQSGQMELMDMYQSATDGRIYLSVLVPILDETNASRPLGVFVLRVDPAKFLFPFIQAWPVPRRTAETLLVRREGDDVLYLNDLRFRLNAALAFRTPLGNRQLPAARAVLGETGIMQGKDYRGVTVVAALRRVSDSPWFLVAKVDQAEANEPIQGQLWQVIATIGLLLFAAGSGVALIWWRSQQRFYLQRLAAAEALMVEKQNLEALFASSPVALIILDETTQIVRVNAAAVALSGTSSAEMLERRPGNALGCLHSMEDPRGCGYSTACRVCAARNAMEALLAKGGAVKGAELQFDLVRHGTMQKVWMAIGAQPVVINGRRHLIVAMEDITAGKQAREEILQLNASLEQRVAARTAELAAANKELESFSYSVSHDLRAPLRSIDGFSRIVLEDYAPKLDADGRDSLNRIRAAAQRMGQLIDDMLNLSRISRAELHRERVDLTALVREVADGLRRHEPARPVELTVADGLAADCDPRLMRIVLENLLGNAWKFTGKCAAPCIEVGVVPATQPATYFVKDNGAGFDEAYAGKLFGVFQRLHSTEQFAGTGIGLANVQRVIHRHGGRVWAAAQVGRGATFYFTLENSAGAETAAARAAGTNSPTR